MKVFLLLILLSACARTPMKNSDESLRLVNDQLLLKDDGEFGPLKKSIQKSIEILEKQKDRILKFGPYNVSAVEYAQELKKALEVSPKEEFINYLQSSFSILEVYGRQDYSNILLTSYYEPIFEGRKKPNKKFKQALYSVPEDLVEVNLKEFSKDSIGRFNTDRTVVAGKLEKTEDGKKLIVPYLNRKEIDIEKQLNSKKLALAYVDPIDAFFLHIQGSGTILFGKNKKLRVGYAAQNGYRYYAIGRELMDVIPQDEMSMQKIENHLRKLEDEEIYKLLSKNESYIFFRKLDGEPETASGATVTDQRTIAVDRSIFPLGSLAYLEYQEPIIAEDGSDTVVNLSPRAKLVMAQDTGGAIKGPGRADFYWGSGDEAKKKAGAMRHDANLYFLVPTILINKSINAGEKVSIL